MTVKTTVIIVNYKASSLALKAVQSVLDSDSIGPVNVVVADNSEDEIEEETLRQYLPRTVSLRVIPENIGFGRACNQAFDASSGDLVFLLNPDARLLPGCLLRLQQVIMSQKNVGGVSPLIYLDEELKCCLPPCCPPSLILCQLIFNSWDPQGRPSRFLSALWRCHSIKVWRSHDPVRVSNLSGGMVLLRREAVKKAGGLFDPRFFLYYEDIDLFIRLKKAGYSLVIEPNAKAIHYYDQCGREDWGAKQDHMIKSRTIFLGKYERDWVAGLRKMLNGISTQIQQDEKGPLMPEFSQPFKLDIPPRLHGGFLFEWGPNPNFIPAIGLFQEGPVFQSPKSCWENVRPGLYFGRLGRPVRHETRFLRFSWKVD